MRSWDWYYEPPDPGPLICDICGGDCESWMEPEHGGCICPECPVCETAADPSCYDRTCHQYHGLERSLAQMAQRMRAERLWEEEARAIEEGELQRLEDERKFKEYWEALDAHYTNEW